VVERSNSSNLSIRLLPTLPGDCGFEYTCPVPSISKPGSIDFSRSLFPSISKAGPIDFSRSRVSSNLDRYRGDGKPKEEEMESRGGDGRRVYSNL
jgi:hypothetical protein